MERIWPVLTSMTTAVPLVALEVSIALASACSDSYWSWESRVSSRPVPGLEATCWVTGDWGRATPARRLHDRLLAVDAGQLGVVPVLEPGRALAGGVGESDDGRGQIPVRHLPLGVGDERDTREGVRRDRLPGRLRELAGQDDVPRLPVQLGGQCGHRNVDDGRERRGRLHRVRDLEVVGHDVVRGDGERQRRTVAVVDATAQRRHRDRDGGLAARRRLVRAGVQDLHVDQPGHHQQHGQNEDQTHKPDATGEGPVLPTAPPALAGRILAGAVWVRALPGPSGGRRRRRGGAPWDGGPTAPGRGRSRRSRPGTGRTGPGRRSPAPGCDPTSSWRRVVGSSSCSGGLNQRARAQGLVGWECSRRRRGRRSSSSVSVVGVVVGVVAVVPVARCSGPLVPLLPLVVPPDGAPAPAEGVVGGGGAGAGVTFGVGRGTDRET